MARRATRTTRDTASARGPRKSKATSAKTPEPAAAPDPAYAPARTPLGADLRRLRAKIIESGEPLLSREAIEQEVADRRGGVG
ncbi:MAG: hypothetical protein ACREJ5_05845 [Geminicoccaceae bacterium]